MHFVKYILALLLYYTGALSAIKTLFVYLAGKDALVVLLYHRVVEDGQRNGSMPEMTVSPKNFAAQIKHISRRYTPVSLEEHLDGFSKNTTKGRPRVMVTLDDGWQDNYRNAYPVLKRNKVPALIFLTTSFIGEKKVFWPERLAQVLDKLFAGSPSPETINQARDLIHSLLIRKPNNTIPAFFTAGKPDVEKIKTLTGELKSFSVNDIESLIAALKALSPEASNDGEAERMTMSWNEVKKMSGDGITFGSHTCTHILMDKAAPDEIEVELKASKKIIEEQLKSKVLSFAYPNGDYNKESLKAVKEAGYRAAFTTQYGLNTSATPLLELKRIRIDDRFSSSPLGGFSACLFEFGIWRHLLSSVKPSFNA